jgi:hypothetical protein
MRDIVAADAELHRQTRTFLELDLARDLYVLLSASAARQTAAACLVTVIKHYLEEAPQSSQNALADVERSLGVIQREASELKPLSGRAALDRVLTRTDLSLTDISDLARLLGTIVVQDFIRGEPARRVSGTVGSWVGDWLAGWTGTSHPELLEHYRRRAKLRNAEPGGLFHHYSANRTKLTGAKPLLGENLPASEPQPPRDHRLAFQAREVLLPPSDSGVSGIGLFSLNDCSRVRCLDLMFGLQLGADVSNTTVDHINSIAMAVAWCTQKENARISQDLCALMLLIPLATMPFAQHHTLLEVALPLSDLGLIDYHIGFYGSLFPDLATTAPWVERLDVELQPADGVGGARDAVRELFDWYERHPSNAHVVFAPAEVETAQPGDTVGLGIDADELRVYRPMTRALEQYRSGLFELPLALIRFLVGIPQAVQPATQPNTTLQTVTRRVAMLHGHLFPTPIVHPWEKTNKPCRDLLRKLVCSYCGTVNPEKQVTCERCATRLLDLRDQKSGVPPPVRGPHAPRERRERTSMKQVGQWLISWVYPYLLAKEGKAYYAELLSTLDDADPRVLRSRSDTVNESLLVMQAMIGMGDRRHGEVQAAVKRNAEAWKQTSGLNSGGYGKTFAQVFKAPERHPIYGCWEARMLYTWHFALSQQRLAIDHQRGTKTDTLNDSTWRHDDFTKSLTANALGDDQDLDEVVDKWISSYREVVTGEDKDDARAFYQQLAAHPSYGTKRLIDELSKPTRRQLAGLERELKPGFERNLLGPQRLKLIALNKLTRRACKFGVEFAIGKGRCVHFLLDGLVDDLSGFDTKLDDTKRAAITVSEFLSVYRKKDELDISKVCFFLGGRTVPAPWDDLKNLPVPIAEQLDKMKKWLAGPYAQYRKKRRDAKDEDF